MSTSGDGSTTTILHVPPGILEHHVLHPLLEEGRREGGETRQRCRNGVMSFLRCCNETWTSEALAGSLLTTRVVRAGAHDGE